MNLGRFGRVVRGILGMGLTFAAIAAAFFSVLAVVGGLLLPGPQDEAGFMILAGSVWGFAIGVGFSSVLAIAARNRSFEELSLPRVAALGAGGGLLIAAILVGTTFSEWGGMNWVVPFSVLPMLGAGAGTASLLIARRAGPLLQPGEEAAELSEKEGAALPGSLVSDG